MSRPYDYIANNVFPSCPQARRSPGIRSPLQGQPIRVRAVPAVVQLEAVPDPAPGSGPQPKVHLRDLFQGVQRPQQLAEAHPDQSRGRPVARLFRVRQDVRHVQRTQAAHAHTLERETVPVRSLFQGMCRLLFFFIRTTILLYIMCAVAILCYCARDCCNATRIYRHSRTSYRVVVFRAALGKARRSAHHTVI